MRSAKVFNLTKPAKARFHTQRSNKMAAMRSVDKAGAGVDVKDRKGSGVSNATHTKRAIDMAATIRREEFYSEDVLALNLIDLNASDSLDDLSKVCDENAYLVRMRSDIDPNNIAVLSWRWDIDKGKTVADARNIRSTKVKQFLEKAKSARIPFAWCDYVTVPQFSTDREALMRHVRASRRLYETCPVCVLDTESIEGVHGISVPTKEYMSRLWCTAEMSAMLTNKNVDYSTFCQVDEWNQEVLSFLCWFHPQNLSDYMEFLSPEKLREKTRGREDARYLLRVFIPGNNLSDGSGHIQDPWLLEVESDLCLNSYKAVGGGWMKARSALDPNDFIPTPLTRREQHELVARYGETDLRENVAVKELIKASKLVKKSAFDTLDVVKHYEALLLVAHRIVTRRLQHRKWNKGLIQELMVSLGELSEGEPGDNKVTLKKFEKSYSAQLKFSVSGDNEKVRQMFIGLYNASRPLVGVSGYRFPTIPEGHHFSWTFPSTLSLESLLHTITLLDRRSFCKRILVFSHVNCSKEMGLAAVTLSFACGATTVSVREVVREEGSQCTVVYKVMDAETAAADNFSEFDREIADDDEGLYLLTVVHGGVQQQDSGFLNWFRPKKQDGEAEITCMIKPPSISALARFVMEMRAVNHNRPLEKRLERQRVRDLQKLIANHLQVVDTEGDGGFTT